jgi:anaerobic selenocysteine-containing dehydrogenase
VVLDLFLNESTAYADIVIPSKFDLEASDLVSSYSIPGISIIQGGPCPFINCKSNYEFFRDLALILNPNDSKWYNASHQEIYDNCLGLLSPEIREKLERDGYYLLHTQKTIPFNDLSFPTSSGKIDLSSINFKFEKEVIKYLIEKEENEFFLITPSYKYFLHSQLGELHSNKLGVFNNIYLNSKDIEKLNPNIKQNMKVLVENERYSAYYVLKEDDSLKVGVACIYSGPSSPSSGTNANFFTPTQPETLGFSGTYNSAKIRIRNKSM